MRYCKTCGVWMKNEDLACPLCQSVMQRESELSQEKRIAVEVISSGYPPVEAGRKKYGFFLRICSFVGVLIMVLLAAVNYITYTAYSSVAWSIISNAGIVYLLWTLRYSIFNGDEALVTKIAVQCIAVMAMCVLTDFVLGFQGWSFDYAIPSILLVADACIVVFMLIDMKNWQNYILLQLFMLLLSASLFLLSVFHLVTNLLLPTIAVGVTSLLVLGTLIFGGKYAETELKRRFHI